MSVCKYGSNVGTHIKGKTILPIKGVPYAKDICHKKHKYKGLCNFTKNVTSRYNTK